MSIKRVCDLWRECEINEFWFLCHFLADKIRNFKLFELKTILDDVCILDTQMFILITDHLLIWGTCRAAQPFQEQNIFGTERTSFQLPFFFKKISFIRIADIRTLYITILSCNSFAYIRFQI